ncbi:MAG TPA: DUF4112 domain-containing protein [Verrucomicrobiae bacterium]|nr:DUF4112 domain-containing protein [Verrucomicrobiae bacterium]
MPRPERRNELRFARLLADLLDQRFTIPGTDIKVGLDPILDLIPGVGDLVSNLAGSVILLIAARMKVPKIVLARMGMNVALNALIGAVPVAGAVFSIWFRSNAMNAALLERYAAAEVRRADWSDWLFVIGVVAVIVLIAAGIVAALVWLLRAIFG